MHINRLNEISSRLTQNKPSMYMCELCSNRGHGQMDGVDNVVTDFYCTLSEGVDYCDQRFFLFLLVSIRNHLSKPHQILCVLPVAMAQSFSGSIAMCYVLLVLQMTCEGRV